MKSRPEHANIQHIAKEENVGSRSVENNTIHGTKGDKWKEIVKRNAVC